MSYEEDSKRDRIIALLSGVLDLMIVDLENNGEVLETDENRIKTMQDILDIAKKIQEEEKA